MPGSTSTSTSTPTATDFNSTGSKTNTNYTRMTPISSAQAASLAQSGDLQLSSVGYERLRKKGYFVPPPPSNGNRQVTASEASAPTVMQQEQ